MNNNTENISIYHNGMFCYKAAFIVYTTRGGGGGGGRGRNFRGQGKNFLGRKIGSNFKVICKLVLIIKCTTIFCEIASSIYIITITLPSFTGSHITCTDCFHSLYINHCHNYHQYHYQNQTTFLIFQNLKLTFSICHTIRMQKRY